MHKDITISGASTYHSYPDGGGKHPGLVVIEEIWGVNAHMRDVVDRFAAEGFSVLSPELLPKGVLEVMTPEVQKALFDPEKRDAVQPQLRASMSPIQAPEFAVGALAILKECVDYLLQDEHVNGHVGVLGFCFGGSYSFHLAAADRRINAAVPFYGQAPTKEEVSSIACDVLAFYGDKDVHLMESLPELKENMNQFNKNFEAVVYENVGHAFFNDTNPRMYNAQSATDAWKKALVFLKKNLA